MQQMRIAAPNTTLRHAGALFVLALGAPAWVYAAELTSAEKEKID
jgi:hypothetical protein